MKRGTTISHNPKSQFLLSYPPPRPTTRAVRQNSWTATDRSVTALEEERGGLGHVFDIIPEDRNYGFEDVYRGSFGENAVLAPGNRELKRWGPEHTPTPLFAKVDSLEAAKRKATVSFSKLCATTDPSAVGGLAVAATLDQQSVLRHRVDVLNTMIKGADSHLCVRHRLLKNEAGPKTLCAVTYNRFLRESVGSDKEVGEIQSPMAWFVPGAQKHVANLLDPRSSVPMAQSMAGLLYGLRKCTPAKYSTKKLLKSLVPRFPATMQEVHDFHKKATAPGAQHAQPSAVSSHHTRVFEAVTELRPSKKKPTALPEKVTVRIIMGVLDLNVLEQWQNPSTNSLVRKSIIETALHHASDPPGTELTNVHSLHVKITRGKESHVLTFRPFIGDEACTVSHLVYTENASGSGPKGLLRLDDDPAQVRPLHGGRIHEIQSYVCLGAHRENRYNEAQLNYIHSRGYIETGTLGNGGAKLPDPHTIQWDGEGVLPPAKATRISGKDCDVMASSYHVGEAVHTVISVICYPPFGTQFKVHPRKNKREKEEARQKREESLRKRGIVIRPRRAAPAAEGAGDHPDGAFVGVAGSGTRAARKRERWTTAPDFAKGQFYFVDHAVLEPWMKEGRLYLIDTGSRGDDTRQVMQQALQIRDEMIRECAYQDASGAPQSIWDPELSFKMNLQTNMKTHPVTKKTPVDIWKGKWQELVARWIQDTQAGSAVSNPAFVRAFWFCKDERVWATMLEGLGVRASICSSYGQWSKDRFAEAIQIHGVSMKFINDNGLQALVPPQIIPRPMPAVAGAGQGKQATAASATPPKELGHLQARIQSLESRLDQTRQHANTASLMQEVLARLRQSC